eukprot:1198065-Pleurochrysis_carterae.AAC.1
MCRRVPELVPGRPAAQAANRSSRAVAGDVVRVTYGELLAKTCQIANLLKSLGGARICRALRRLTTRDIPLEPPPPPLRLAVETWTARRGPVPTQTARLHPSAGVRVRLAPCAPVAFAVGKGDRVCLYMPMVPEAAYAMLACARLGAIHSVVFAGFSAEAHALAR